MATENNDKHGFYAVDEEGERTDEPLYANGEKIATGSSSGGDSEWEVDGDGNLVPKDGEPVDVPSVSTGELNGTVHATTASEIETAVANAGDGTKIVIADGEYTVDNPLTLDMNMIVEGCGKRDTQLKKANDAPLFELVDNNRVHIRDLSIRSDIADTTEGILTSVCNRAFYRDLWIVGMGGDGLRHEDGNNSEFTSIESTNNGGDGIVLEGVDCNGCTITNMDCRNNTGHGCNIDNGYATTIIGGYNENNDQDGLRIDDNYASFWGYSGESNGGYEIHIDTTASHCMGWMGGGSYQNNGDQNCHIIKSEGLFIGNNGHKIRLNQAGALDIQRDGGWIHMKSPDGTQWQITVDNSGNLQVN